MDTTDSSAALAEAENDSRIVATAHAILDATLHHRGRALIDDILLLLYQFNQDRNREVALLKAEVLRLRRLIVEPIQTGVVLPKPGA